MDGLTRLLAPPSRRSPLIGILYAEDFDDPHPEPGPQPAPAPPPALTQHDIDQACDAAVAAARRQWQDQAEQAQTALLAEIASALATARQAAEQIASSTAEAAAQTILAMLSAALPHFCAEHGPAEARAIADHLLPTLQSEPRVVIRVHPDLAPGLQQICAARQTEFGGTITVLPAPLEPGDVKIEWENGALSRDTRQILQAMQDALARLGLQPPRDTTPNRRMAHEQ